MRDMRVGRREVGGRMFGETHRRERRRRRRRELTVGTRDLPDFAISQQPYARNMAYARRGMNMGTEKRDKANIVD